eukprot:scaffold111560_cov13-Tisochrysis_lutea.AAC.1
MDWLTGKKGQDLWMDHFTNARDFLRHYDTVFSKTDAVMYTLSERGNPFDGEVIRELHKRKK